jgi:hypothetical protein
LKATFLRYRSWQFELNTRITPSTRVDICSLYDDDQMRPEYDFSSGVRGKYLPRLAKGANVVVLDRDMAKVFPTSKSVNDALRVLAEAGRRHGKVKASARCG